MKDLSQRLAKASSAERAAFEIPPCGYSIRRPLIDADLSIDGLLGIKHRPGLPGAKVAVYG